MKILGFEITRTKASVPAMSVDNSRGWVRLVGEPWGGAWQANIRPDSEPTLLAFAAVYGCVTGIARDVAKLCFRAVQESQDGICVPIPKTSPIAAFFRRPNHFQNRIQFIENWVVSKLTTGNTVALKERDGRRMVRALYLLDWARVTPLVADDGEIFYRLNSDRFAGVREAIVVPAGEIVHDRYCPLWHPLLGVSPLYAAGMSATMGNKITANSATFFANMARPSGMLYSEQPIDPATAEQMKRQWREQYGGEKLGDIAVGSNGLKYLPIMMSSEDAQLIEQLKWTAGDVAAAFHYPLYKLGGAIPQGAKVEDLNQSYYSECLQPIIECLEVALTEGLELPDGIEAEADLDGLLRMDQASAAEAEEKLVGGGIKSPNEARVRFNLAPVPGGETPYLQEQNWPLGHLSQREVPTREPTKPAPVPAHQPPGDSAKHTRDFAAEAIAIKAIASEALQQRLAA